MKYEQRIYLAFLSEISNKTIDPALNFIYFFPNISHLENITDISYFNSIIKLELKRFLDRNF